VFFSGQIFKTKEVAMSQLITFKQQITKNLEMNGFPKKKVSFNLEKMYEMADNKNLSLNAVLDELAKEQILNEKTVDKIIFYKEEVSAQFDMNADMLKQAQEMLSKMSSEEINNLKSMFENMTPEEKQQMMEQAKSMGLSK
jgi:hypothetical protein